MRKILISTFALALVAVAFAGPPIDYELTCGEGGELIGVLSLTEGKVRVALVAGFICDGVDVFVSGPDDAPEIAVTFDWDTDPLGVTVTIGAEATTTDDVDVVVVPPVAVDGMLNAQRLRAAAMEQRAEAIAKREEAHAKRDAAREGDTRGDQTGEDGDHGDQPTLGPPESLTPGERAGGSPEVLPPAHAPTGRH